MFAGAAREVVFANPDVVRHIQQNFIPVALKAALVNNPPAGPEGAIYREISRSKPAPQGICTLNSDGKVLAWALSFDDEDQIVKFLDHVVERYAASPDGQQPVTAERFMKFPSRPLDEVADHGRKLEIPATDDGHDCPGELKLEPGTVAGRIIGRPLDAQGEPIARTFRQEEYMEAKFFVPPQVQEELAAAVADAQPGERFRLPESFVRSLVGPAFLGQLDVNPLGQVPGSRNEAQEYEFYGQVLEADGASLRLRLEGVSDVAGAQGSGPGRGGDGRLWEHRVALDWQGYVELHENRITELAALAQGHERLRWGNERFAMLEESDAAHLMAGHPIDFKGPVRYGLWIGAEQ